MLAKGQYIGWVDSDDYIASNMMECLYNVAVETESDIVICDYSFFPEKLRSKEKWYKEYKGTVDWNFIERNTQQWNKLISRSLLQKINMEYWMEYCGEGAYALALIQAKHITTINDKLYFYRVGHSSISTSLNSNWYIDDVIRTERQYEMILENGLASEWDEYFQYRVIYSIIKSLIVLARTGMRREFYVAKQKLQALRIHKNQFTKLILDNNFGKLKSLVIRRIIPLNFYLSRVITNIVLG